MKCHGDLKSVLLVQFQKYEDADRRGAVLFSFVTSMGGGAGKFRDIYFYFGVLEWVSVIFTTYADAEELVSYPRASHVTIFTNEPIRVLGFWENFQKPISAWQSSRESISQRNHELLLFKFVEINHWLG